MNIQMTEDEAILGKISEGDIVLQTYPNGSFDIAVVDNNRDGKIVAEGKWKGYDKPLTDSVWNKLRK
jgi:hypothetical protein